MKTARLLCLFCLLTPLLSRPAPADETKAAAAAPAEEAGSEEAWQVPVLLTKDGWLIYENPRFGFSLPVPPGMQAQRPPDNGGGQAFTSADGKVRVVGWAHFNLENVASVDAAWKDALATPDRTITYKKKADGWFVVSGVNKDGTGFYVKHFADAKYFSGFSITYPQADERKYQPWIERIAKEYQARLGKGADRLEEEEEEAGQ